MHIVETYDPTPGDYHDILGTRSWPSAAMVEDDHGIRWMIQHHSLTEVSEHHWRRALAAGAAGIAIADPDGGWHSATAERYAALRSGEPGAMTTSADMPALFHLRAVEQAAPAPRAGNGFVNLHTHTEYSPMDGLTRIGQLVEIVTAQGGHAVGITDHGTCAGHAELHTRAAAAGLKPVYGLETYLVDDVDQRGASNDYWHLILLAKTDQGLRNLWAASTEAHRRGFFHKPRMDWDILARHAEGLIATTACLSGPVSKAILADDRDAAAARLARLHRIFGDDLYAEIHTYLHPDQRKVNEALASLASMSGIPLVAAADSHYPTPADHDRHQVWIAATTSKGVGETGMFADGAYHLHTPGQVRAALDYLPPEAVQEALDSTVAIADAVDAQIRTRKILPVSGPKATHASDAAKLRELALAGRDRLTGPDQWAYRRRFEAEMKLLVEQDFCGYFLIVADYVRWAKDNGILVGPARGSGGASLVAYMTRIIEIDPVRWDLPFERFLTPGRASLPDFDIDFPTSKRADIFAYLAARWGEEHVVSIGTVSRLRNKGVAKELERALRPTFGALASQSFDDMQEVSKIIDEAENGTAGLGLSWEELWDQEGDRLAPYRDRYPVLFQAADHLVGLLKTYGKHAAGAVISTVEPLADAMPLRGGEDGTRMITQFDDDGVEMLGFVKYDVLTLRHLDTITQTIEAVAKRTGVRVDPYALAEHLDDQATWDMLCSGQVLGCFQIETYLGARMVKAMRPRTLRELADVITLVRPGPTRSGITATYLARRDGREPVTVPDPRLEQVLAPTYGTMIYQEQVLAICRIIAGYDDAEADDIRKILGKKQIEKIDSAGRDFIARAVERGMDRDRAVALWDQMADFSRYAFGKAHAYGYALLCWWTAYLKTHHPVEFLAATLSTVEPDRIPEFVKECRRLDIQVLPPDINTSGLGFTIDGTSVRYGFDSLKGIGETPAKEIVAHQPYTGVEDLITRTGKAVHKGTVAILARAGCFDTLEPHRAALVARLAAEKSGESKRCRFKTDELPEGELPCAYDWDNEPWTLDEPCAVNPRTLKLLPRKPAPKRCTASCRRYSPPQALDPAEVPVYTAAQVGAIELETFGLYLTWTPFDRVADRALREEHRDLAERLAEGATARAEHLLAYVEDVYGGTTSHGQRKGTFVLATEGPDLRASCFSPLWERLDPDALAGSLVAVTVVRKDRWLNIKSIEIL